MRDRCVASTRSRRSKRGCWSLASRRGGASCHRLWLVDCRRRSIGARIQTNQRTRFSSGTRGSWLCSCLRSTASAASLSYPTPCRRCSSWIVSFARPWRRSLPTVATATCSPAVSGCRSTFTSRCVRRCPMARTLRSARWKCCTISCGGSTSAPFRPTNRRSLRGGPCPQKRVAS